MLLGDLAIERSLVDGAVLCGQVDELFQADPSSLSVVISVDEGVCLINRSAFYQALAGRLGFGWPLYHGRPISELPVVAGRTFPAGEAVVTAALTLLTGDVLSGDDVLVTFPDGRVGTIAVTALVGELAAVHARQADRLSSSEQWLRSLLENSRDVVVILDERGAIRYASPALERVTGYDAAARVGGSAFDHIHPDDAIHAQALLRRALSNPGVELGFDFRLRVADGSWRWFEGSGRNLLGDPAVGGIVFNYRDVTERRALEERLRHQALHDPLTGLANRSMLADRAARALDRLARTGRAMAVVFCDLDGFKIINDTNGHHVGDQLLVAVAERLGACVRSSDTLARLGGDEFAVLAEDLESVADAAALAERIVAALREPVTTNGAEITITASVGVAATDSVLADPDELIRRADLAMYGAKLAGKNRWAWWTPEVNQAVLGEGKAVDDFRRALDQGQFVVYYQPIFSLPERRLAGAEALVRWEHPERGLVSPGEFITLAERSGLIMDLGQHVLSQACDQLRVWREARDVGDDFVLNVNVSAVQLARADIADQVAAVLDAASLPPGMLQLEITETALVEHLGAVSANLAALRALGVRIAIDDFGTGYGSLTYLQRFPISALKVDSSFVQRLGTSQEDYLIVASVVQLAHSLGVSVTAEGIEADHQLASLVALDCDQAQGYHFARPVPAGLFLSTARSAAEARS